MNYRFFCFPSTGLTTALTMLSLLLVFCLSFSAQAEALHHQSNNTILDASELEETVFLNPYLDIYHTQVKNLSIDEISNINDFMPTTHEDVNLGYSSGDVWFRLQLNNTSSTPRTLYLESNFPFFYGGGRHQTTIFLIKYLSTHPKVRI